MLSFQNTSICYLKTFKIHFCSFMEDHHDLHVVNWLACIQRPLFSLFQTTEKKAVRQLKLWLYHSKQAEHVFCNSAWQMPEAMYQWSGISVFCTFFLVFFSPLSRLVFGLFGDMLRARLCQIEDRKTVKEKERRQIKLQCVPRCKEWHISASGANCWSVTSSMKTSSVTNLFWDWLAQTHPHWTYYPLKYV